MSKYEKNTHLELVSLLKSMEEADKGVHPGYSVFIKDIAELKAEINKREEDGYKFVLHFEATSNEDGEVIENSIFLYECPKNARETEKLIANTYDGVWNPIPKSHSLFALTVVV